MRPFRPLAAVSAVTVAILAACGDPFALPAPVFSNIVDTVSVYALHGTAVALPSGYRLQDRQVVRTDVDQQLGFDFAFDIDPAGNVLVLSTGAMGLGAASGVQISDEPFDSILVASTRDYELDSAVVVQVGEVVLLQSRLTTCSFGIPAFFYGKMQVLNVDTTSGPNGRRIDLHILVNRNCGYRGLDVGLPDR